MSKLKAEISQSRPFAGLEEEAFLNLQRTSALLAQDLGRLFKSKGLTTTQYNALRILRGAHPDALTCSTVGERMVTPVPDTTRLLDRLASRNLVVRDRDSKDRRIVNVKINDAGLEVLAELDDPLRAWLDERLGHFEPQELKGFIEMLENARTSLV